MTFCPHCGYNITPDEPVTLGDWDLHPAETYHNAVRLPLTPQESAALHTLAKAQGRAVSADTLGSRIGAAKTPETSQRCLCGELGHRPYGVTSRFTTQPARLSQIFLGGE